MTRYAPFSFTTRWPHLLFQLAAGLALALGPPPAQAATFTVTKTADTADGACDADCSLREAIIAANAAAGADDIIVPAGTYTLTIAGAGENAAATGDLDITPGGLTITGAGAATTIINGGAIDRVFHIVVSGATASISGVTIQNGTSIFVDGGGIWNVGTLTLTNSIVSSNTTSIGSGNGGGLQNNGTATITGCTFTNNSASDGGAIDNDPGATLTITASAVTGNSAGSEGGGIENSGTLLLVASTVNGNTAGSDSGGLENFGAGVMMIDTSTVSNNVANTGGGIENSANLSVNNSTFTNRSIK